MALKVLQVMDHLAYGGGQFSLKGIVENVDSEQCEMFVCELRPNPPAVAIKGKFIGLRYGRYDPRVIFAIASLCKKYRIDIMHPHLPKAIISSLAANIICKCPVVVHIRGAVFSQEMGRLSLFLYWRLLKLLRKRASVFIANSNATANKLVERIKIRPDRIIVLHNPVDFSVFKPQPGSRNHLRKMYGIDERDTVLGYVGRLHKIKGVDLLIKAMSILLERDRNYFLLLAGDGPERTRLETLVSRLGIADRVKFLGMRDDVPEIMSTFDISVIPSRHEPFGRVAAELMRMKVPIVTSGAGGLSELVTDGETGLVTRENSPEEIAAAVERLADDEELRRQLAQRAYEFSERFDIKAHVKEIEKIYMELIEEAKGNGRKRKRHFL